ncbi:MAG: HAD-IB family phosphatase [Desulfuromonadales bacterium]
MKNNTKAAIFDIEGTLFKRSYRFDFIKERFPENWHNLCLCHGEESLVSKQFSSAWTLLCDLLGPEASKKNQANWEKWRDGGYPGYSEWVIDTIKLHKEYGLTRKLFDAVIHESAEYFPGVAETFETLRSQGITIALVSGGLKAMADRVSLDFKLEHCFTSAEYFWNPDGTIRHWNCQPSDFIHKKSLVKLLLHDLGFSKEKAVFIGDGGNDREVAQYVGYSIGFNPKPYHEFFWNDFVREDDLRAVLVPLGLAPSLVSSSSKRSKADSNEPDQATKTGFRKFLVEHGGLTENSSRSYITYLNCITLNMQGAVKAESSTSRTPLHLLFESAKAAKSEAAFIKALAKPLTGPDGRIGDLTSTAKQFYRFARQFTC